jgi:hypothetical protein
MFEIFEMTIKIKIKTLSKGLKHFIYTYLLCLVIKDTCSISTIVVDV